jgi:hypothetical protein
LRGSEEADLTYLDASWACGTFRYLDDDDKPVVSIFAARLVR